MLHGAQLQVKSMCYAACAKCTQGQTCPHILQRAGALFVPWHCLHPSSSPHPLAEVVVPPVKVGQRLRLELQPLAQLAHLLLLLLLPPLRLSRPLLLQGSAKSACFKVF